MREAPNPKRAACAICLRPRRSCICRWITRIEHEVELLILQHPLEAANAKGSARLLHLSLPRSRLITGETFAPQELQAALHAPLVAPVPPAAGMFAARPRQPVLLYPETTEAHALGMTRPVMLDETHLPDLASIRLVVLDGTWRKSRKMLYANPLLQALPRLALRDPPPSRYLIRKAHGAHQLSTLEAACYALMQLERNGARYQPLLDAFSGFVSQQIALAATARQAGDQRSC